MLKSCSEVVFLVDMNIDMLQNINNKNLHSPTNPLADFCGQFCLPNTIVEPTGMTRTSKTLIDVILVNQPERWATSGTLQLGTSDHDLVYIARKQGLPKPKANVIESRSMKHFNVDAFLADLATTPWDTTFVYDDIDDIWAHWSKLYNDTIKNHAPTIKKIVQTSPNPWINVHIKKAMRKDISQEDIHLMDNGKVVMEPSDLLNTFFSTPVLEQTILALSQDDFRTHLNVTSVLSRDFSLDFSFQPVSAVYIGTLLGKVKSNKSSGPDNIMPNILKLSAPSLGLPLTKLLNLCITTSTWPTEWKLSNVTPVFKNDYASLVSNYRPISILSAIPKILEKVIFDQLYNAFQPPFSLNMPGFLRGHSCYTALIKMVDDWRLALDSKKVTGSIAIDLSKAFDSICHSLLLAKLSAYGVGDEATRFLHSFLSDRKQTVKVNGVLSD
ncbi:hypothetical protein ACROYT_G031165 [Oculina patagonica]